MKKPPNFYFFRRKPIPHTNRYDRWRRIAELSGLSSMGRLRLEWIIFYLTVAKENATLTCNHFGISRKTFYKWFNRFKGSQGECKGP